VSIPLFATRAVIEPLLAEVAERQRQVLDSGRYILGPEVEGFESEFAEYLGVRHCVGVANGTDALAIGLRALGVGPGDEVVVPSLTFYATAEAVAAIGATPVFCDVDPETMTMTAATAEPALGERSAAILPVHLFGNPAPMGELLELAHDRGLRLLEDAAQAAGAEVGNRRAGAVGDAGAFSFFPSKNLGGFGDGGALVTDDDEVAAIARRLRSHGSDDRLIHLDIGYNSRLNELQAAALRVLLPHRDAGPEGRRAVAAAYAEGGLGDVVLLPGETEGASCCFHLYVVRSERRDLVAAALREGGIETRSYYTTPLHRQPALAEHAPEKELPVTERAAATSLALPMGPALTEGQVGDVIGAVASCLAGS
jgi:dTDP-3-amino-3,4,6-trideoxy-alpha-D-glucose transaminase